MIVNTITGEILDLSPLARKPKGPPTKRLNQRPSRKRARSEKRFVQTLVLLGLIMVIAGYAALHV